MAVVEEQKYEGETRAVRTIDDNLEEDSAPDESVQQLKRKRKRKRKRKGVDIVDVDVDVGGLEAEQQDATQQSQDSVDKRKELELDRTIYVEGIPFDASREKVIEFFKSNGLSEESLLDLRLPVWQDSGRLRGYGHVVFDNDQNYKAALKLNRSYMGQRYLTIQAAHAPNSKTASRPLDPTANPSRTLMFNNLSYEASEDDIKISLIELFKNDTNKFKQPTIVDGGIRVVRHSHTGRSKGFAYVEFADQEDAIQVVKCVQNKPLVICSRSCRIDYDHGRVRGSFRTADRKLWYKEYSNKGDISGHSPLKKNRS